MVLKMDALKEGICGSGDSFEMNHSETDYNIVDMEAYPLALIAQKENIPFLCLKYISDDAGSDAADDWSVQVHWLQKPLKNIIFINFYPMTSVTINKASLEDLEIIQTLGIQTFSETFAENNTEEAMKMYLEESFNTGKLQSELNNADSIFYIAWEEDNPVGYLKVNSEKHRPNYRMIAVLKLKGSM
jgi:hypothetical protein